MQEYHKIQTLFKRDMDGTLTGRKGQMIEGARTTPELEYLAGLQWDFSEKVDGTNIRVGNEDGVVEIAGRTDRAVIPDPLAEFLKDTFTPTLFKTAELPPGTILFGEGYGPKIQGGGKYRGDHSFVLFDVKIGDFWLSRDNVANVGSNLNLDVVPRIGSGTLYQAINFVKYGTPYLDEEVATIQRVTDYNGWLEKGFMRSQWGDFEAEGIVARPVVDLFNRKGERIITKIKAVDFK